MDEMLPEAVTMVSILHTERVAFVGHWDWLGKVVDAAPLRDDARVLEEV